ncbi:MAG TPA: hypothetical protein VG097_21210 [Gemmata sp.]|nr:hypothetical protein [Gemmata sp.]
MPIVELCSEGHPLNQGDILRDITLFVTKNSWIEKGFAAKAPFKLCLVVSRPCVIENKQHITVIGVEKYPEDTPREIDSFDKVLDFMTGARDGVTSPDVFYLGQLPGLSGRYCARLDSFHDIEIPPVVDKATRSSFLATARIATLSPDFLRALHSRLFGAFANMGFDDCGWPSTEDLTWIVTQGQADISKLEGQLKQQQANKLSREAEGKKFDDRLLFSIEQELDKLKLKVQPFLRESDRRKQADKSSTDGTPVPVTSPTSDPNG